MLYDILRSLIHHGWNKLILVNGHGSNVKVLDPLLRRIKYETGALVALYKPYAERYIGILEGLLDNPPEETPGWHASELETSQVMAHNASLVRMDRAAEDRAQAPEWLPDSFLKSDGAPDVQFEGYQYFSFPMDHGEFSRTGVIGNPMTATAEKGEEALTRFSGHLVRADRRVPRPGCQVRRRAFEDACEHHAPALRRAQILERIQRDGGVSVADLARELTVSSITVHRTWSSCPGRARRARARRRAGAPGRRARGRDPADGLGAARGGRRGAKAAIAAHAARGAVGLDDLPGLVLVLPGAGAPAGERVRHEPDAGRRTRPAIAWRARRRADAGDRHAGRAGPAHAAARGPLDDRLPVRAQLRAGVRVLRGRDARRRG